MPNRLLAWAEVAAKPRVVKATAGKARRFFAFEITRAKDSTIFIFMLSGLFLSGLFFVCWIFCFEAEHAALLTDIAFDNVPYAASASTRGHGALHSNLEQWERGRV